jgi:hypothetical protein
VLRERVDVFILLGSAIIVTSVALVTSAKVKTRAPHDLGRDREVPVEAGD